MINPEGWVSIIPDGGFCKQNLLLDNMAYHYQSVKKENHLKVSSSILKNTASHRRFTPTCYG